MDLVAEITQDVLCENDFDPMDEDTFDAMMDVSSRIYIGSM